MGGQQVTDILQLWVHPPAPPSQQGWCFSKREDSCCVSFLPGLEFSPSQQEPSALWEANLDSPNSTLGLESVLLLLQTIYI